ncbi:MAG: flippase-like domain-containing protein [Thermomicrobium sp.]|nr:flippase-like domain-containing protein [Thermomicrobium sp.]
MRRFVVIVMVASACGIALWSFADLDTIRETLDRLTPDVLVALFLLLAANELLKGLRWAWYLRAAQLPIRTIDGLTSYLAAQAASALPGGALLSARLAEEHGAGRVRLRHTTPPLVAQGFGDLLAVSLLAVTGILLTGQGPLQLLAPFAGTTVAVVLIAAVRSERLGQWVVGLLRRSRRMRHFLPVEEDARKTLRTLCRPHALLPGIVASIGSSLIAAAILVSLAGALTLPGLALREALYVHSLTMLAHFLLPIPNGFGTNELSLVGLLNIVGIGFGRATAIAVVYRTIGLGFRTLIGLLVLIGRYHHLLAELHRQPAPQRDPLFPMELAIEERE